MFFVSNGVLFQGVTALATAALAFIAAKTPFPDNIAVGIFDVIIVLDSTRLCVFVHSRY